LSDWLFELKTWQAVSKSPASRRQRGANELMRAGHLTGGFSNGETARGLRTDLVSSFQC
jgi:hypothetical protein